MKDLPNWVTLLVTITGWIVVHRLSVCRDRRNEEARKRDAAESRLQTAKTQFISVVGPFRDDILKSDSLVVLQNRSRPPIKQAVHNLLPHLDVENRVRLETAWRKYDGAESYKLAGVQKQHAPGAGVVTDYTAARKTLMEPLEEMLNVAAQ